MKLELKNVIPDPAQPRKHFDPKALERLGVSMDSIGQQQPITTRWDAALGKDVIVAGNRRYLAACMRGWTHIEAIRLEGDAPEEVTLVRQVSENEIREAMTLGELARAIERMKAAGMTTKQLHEKYGFSPARICRAEAYLRVAKPIQELADAGLIPESSVYDIERHPDPAAQLDLAQALSQKKMTRDQVTAAVQAAAGKRNVRQKASRAAFKVNGYSIAVSGEHAVTLEGLLEALDTLRKEARKATDLAGLVKQMRT